jgi:hypothetical protein
MKMILPPRAAEKRRFFCPAASFAAALGPVQITGALIASRHRGLY